MDVLVSNEHEIYKIQNVPVQITEDDKIPIILGRYGFFEEFEIIIDESEKKVKLKKKPSAKGFRPEKY